MGKKKKPKREWTKFERAYIPDTELAGVLADLKQKMPDKAPEELEKWIAEEARAEVWMNNFYQVAIYRDIKVGANWPPMIHLSIKRRDRHPVHDWRHFQRIKNELIGPECEAVELYPSERRLVDLANQYHLWVIADPEHQFPFGFQGRQVGDFSIGKSKQRSTGKTE